MFGGAALLLGFYERAVAFVLSGDMAAAYFLAHFPRSFYPAVNGGDAAVLYCFVFFYIALAGGGAWSLDNVLKRRRASALDGPAPAAHPQASARGG